MSTKQPKRILTLQPFYGGSHQQFIDGWIENSFHSWELLHLPARNWKWRMRHAAVHFAAAVDRMYAAGESWDLLVCTDMLNLAEFKGLLQTGAKNIPTLMYFHENQFEYPNQHEAERDVHFSFSNFTSALAADLVWFNSAFNRDSMLGHLRKLATKWPDYAPVDQIEDVATKANVQSPGVEFIAEETRKFGAPLRLVWAARWEHDKGPQLLLEILTELQVRRIEFEISVIGQQFRNVPPQFETISKQFAQQIRHWGFREKRGDYMQALVDSDLFLSTAAHEFFGLSTVEAVCCGCLPVLPNRLVYPELIRVDQNPGRQQILYESATNAVDFVESLNQPNNIGRVETLRLELTKEFRERYTWANRAASMDAAITGYL